MVSFGQKLNGEKHARNLSRITLELFYAKHGSKNHLILKKWKVFENRHIGHLPLPDGQFGSKIKIVKNMRKNIETNNRIVLCRKRLQKSPNRKKTSFRKLPCWPLCKGYSLCKIVSLHQILKLGKTREKISLELHKNCSMQNTAAKITLY